MPGRDRLKEIQRTNASDIRANADLLTSPDIARVRSTHDLIVAKAGEALKAAEIVAREGEG